MRQLRLLFLALFAILAFGAVASAVASAEEDKGSPSLLILEGNVTELTGLFKWEKSVLSVLKLPSNIESASGEAKLKGCKEFEASKVDTRLCEALLDFFKVKVEGSAACRSETATEKDPVETVLVKANVHLGSELSQAKVLQPIAIFLILGEDGKDLKLNCGLVKLEILGAIPCLLLPGLKEIAAEKEEWEVVCETDLTENKPNGDKLFGTCLQLCEMITEEPFGALFFKEGEKVHEMAAFLVKAKGKFSKDAIIDD